MSAEFELLDRWRAGDRQAGSELLARHFDAIYSFFRSKLDAGADDLTQQTFLRCVEARDDLRNTCGLRAYLFVVARNLLFDHLRRNRRWQMDVDFEVTSLADLDPSASTDLVVQEEHKLLVHALRRLPLDLQIILELGYVQRLRGPELAAVLGIPLGTVRSRFRRSIERLRAILSELAASPQAVRTTMTDLQRWAAAVRVER